MSLADQRGLVYSSEVRGSHGQSGVFIQMYFVVVYSKPFISAILFQNNTYWAVPQMSKHDFGFVFQAPSFFDHDLMPSDLNMELYWYM